METAEKIYFNLKLTCFYFNQKVNEQLLFINDA